MPDIPEAFIGATVVRQPAFWGLWKQRKGIGLEFRRYGDLRHQADAVEFDAEVDMFANPPTMFVSNLGVMQVSFRDGVVVFDSSDGELKLRGKISEDMRRIDGTVDIQNFQLMDISGDFANCPITLEATNVESDEA